jgi:hypothetical protein
MSSRRSPSGPSSLLTGFVTLAQTVIAPGTAGIAATATGIAQAFFLPHGTAAVPVATPTRMNPKNMSTNDVVSASPRGTAVLGTSQIGLSHARVSSVGSASAVIELSFINPSTASATLVANTWNLGVFLQSTDL